MENGLLGIVILIFLVCPFFILGPNMDLETRLTGLVLTFILCAVFPQALAVVFVLDVIAIITWFCDAPKRRKFKARMEEEKKQREAEKEKERKFAQWWAEEQEYEEYKKSHW